MENMKIGNWEVSDKGINWIGTKTNAMGTITLASLKDGGNAERTEMYDWLIHLCEKSWITDEDIYALNTAFIYAIEKYKLGFSDKLSFVKTFTEQQRQLQQK